MGRSFERDSQRPRAGFEQDASNDSRKEIRFANPVLKSYARIRQAAGSPSCPGVSRQLSAGPQALRFGISIRTNAADNRP